MKGPDTYNSQVLIEATVIALTKLQPLLNKVITIQKLSAFVVGISVKCYFVSRVQKVSWTKKNL